MLHVERREMKAAVRKPDERTGMAWGGLFWLSTGTNGGLFLMW